MDLAAYLQRIGYEGPRETTRAVLAGIALRHAIAIPFENLDAFIGRRVSLDPVAVEEKMVHRGRGGWCFEQGVLMGNALRALKFPVTDLAARVLWNRPADAMTPRTHRLLRVEAEGRSWLMDGGFGGQTLTGVLDLDNDAPQATPHEPFRLRREGEQRVLESQIRGEWLALCRFDLHAQLPIDFEAANYQLAHDPESHFTQGLTVSRATPDGRHVLRGHPLHGVEMVFHAAGESRRVELHTVDAILAKLHDPFGLPLDELPELPARLQRLLAERAAHVSATQASGSPARS